MNKKSWVVFIAIVVAIIGGMVYMSGQNKLDVSDISEEKMEGIIGAEERNGNLADHTTGNTKAKVVLIEYGDYQCPGCSTAAPKAKALAEKYKDNMMLIFRNFPIPSLHPNARAAAAAAESAGIQGKFWEMHDMLYSNQDAWSEAAINERTEIFVGYADELGLDKEKFKKDLSDAQITKKINFDVAVGRNQGVTGTPTFYLNGEQVEATDDADYLETAVKKAFKEAGIEVEDSETTEE